jgi:DNA-directed RNA polymerase subunit N (RpoN/RPB10)
MGLNKKLVLKFIYSFFITIYTNMKPIRCFTCNKILGNKWETINRLLEEGKELKEIYEMIGITRYCCKRIIMTSVDTLEIENQKYDIQDNITIHNINPSKNFLKSV